MLEQKGIICLEQFFLDKYHYQYIDNEQLVSQPFIEYEGVGATAMFWIKDGDTKYLYKEVEDGSYAWLGEILSSEIAKILNIPCAEYRLVTLNGTVGILSKNFLKENQTLVLGAEIIQRVLDKYPYLKGKSVFDDELFLELYNIPENLMKVKWEHRRKYLLNNLNNIEQIWSILDIYCDLQHIKKDNLALNMNHLVKVFFFDLLTLQADRHIENWAFLEINREGESMLIPSPLFDQAASFGLVCHNFDKRVQNFFNSLENYQRVGHEKSEQQLISNLYKERLLLTPSEDAIINAKERRRKNNLEVLNYFLEVSDFDDINTLLGYIETLENIGMENIIESIESFYNISIDPKVHKFICDIYSFNLKFLKRNIYQKRS